MAKDSKAKRTLKEIREEKALSMRDMARKAGVSPITIARIENGLPVTHATKLKVMSRGLCEITLD
jgi:transcriptional regulator with XRE-family HTH domain